MKLNFAPECDTALSLLYTVFQLERLHNRDRKFPSLEQSFTRAVGHVAMLTLFQWDEDHSYVHIIFALLARRWEFFR